MMEGMTERMAAKKKKKMMIIIIMKKKRISCDDEDVKLMINGREEGLGIGNAMIVVAMKSMPWMHCARIPLGSRERVEEL